MTMDAKHLDRAQKIIEGIEWCRDVLSFPMPNYSATNHLPLIKGKRGSGEPERTISVSMSRAMRDAAFAVFRREVELKEAALRREAAQIGLKLEDGANV